MSLTQNRAVSKRAQLKLLFYSSSFISLKKNCGVSQNCKVLSMRITIMRISGEWVHTHYIPKYKNHVAGSSMINSIFEVRDLNCKKKKKKNRAMRGKKTFGIYLHVRFQFNISKQFLSYLSVHTNSWDLLAFTCSHKVSMVTLWASIKLRITQGDPACRRRVGATMFCLVLSNPTAHAITMCYVLSFQLLQWLDFKIDH